uniref:Secreted protein n=1 Tax=Strongyloides papillosus TaxID=174720 RepID=A0A0N5BDH5_STREA
MPFTNILYIFLKYFLSHFLCFILRCRCSEVPATLLHNIRRVMGQLFSIPLIKSFIGRSLISVNQASISRCYCRSSAE